MFWNVKDNSLKYNRKYTGMLKSYTGMLQKDILECFLQRIYRKVTEDVQECYRGGIEMLQRMYWNVTEGTLECYRRLIV